MRAHRASRGYTYEPCHGCGAEEHRKKGTLCQDCRSKLDAAALQFEQAKAEDRVVVTIPGQPHWLPSYYGHPGASMTYETNQGIQQALHAIMLAVGVRVPDSVDGKDLPGGAPERWNTPMLVQRSDSSYSPGGARYLIPSALVEPIRQLDALILKGLGEVAEKNRTEGRNLLLSLQSGELSLKDFEREVIPLSERKRR